MGRLRAVGWGLALIVLTTSAGGCGAVKDIARDVVSNGNGGCYAEIEWVDFLQINDIRYSRLDGAELPADSGGSGAKVGEITYMLSDHACADYKQKNGDAAFLPIGTAVHAMPGYKPSFRVVAGGKVYQVEENKQAATMGDLLDIAGKVKKVSLVSGMDGSDIGDFTAEDSEAFVRELLPLANVGFNQVYKASKGDIAFSLRLHLLDGTSFGMGYYPRANGFTAGAFATDELGTMIVKERERIKRAAGM